MVVPREVIVLATGAKTAFDSDNFGLEFRARTSA
jgi:hypothetical protein